MTITLADLKTLVGLQLGKPNIDETAHFVEVFPLNMYGLNISYLSNILEL